MARDHFRVYVQNLSSNGTFVNSFKLKDKGERRLLHNGDEIALIHSLDHRLRARPRQSQLPSRPRADRLRCSWLCRVRVEAGCAAQQAKHGLNSRLLSMHLQ